MINLTKKQLLIILGAGIAVICVIGYYIYSSNSSESYEQLELISEKKETEINKNVENNSEENEEIVVHIAGEVKQPGIVKIKDGSRIADIIEKAGGLTDQANLNNINLAYIVEDGQKITIPSKQEEIKEHISNQGGEGIIQGNPEMNTSQNTTIKNLKININKATKEELQSLSGIGESTAQKIIDYRKENGEFKQIEDLKNVSGIGEAKYNAIKDNIKVK